MTPHEETQIERRDVTDPWTSLDQMFEDLQHRFLGAGALIPFSPRWLPRFWSDGSALRAAPVDVTDTGAAFKVVAEIPGIPKEKLDIQVRETSVEIRGESETKSEESKGEFLHRERTHQGFYRTFELPEPVVPAEAKAKLENGVLELELPKQHPAPSAEPVKVAVQ